MRAVAAGALLLWVVSAEPLSAQDTFRYRLPSGPLCYVTANPYHLFHVRGGDTLGSRVSEHGAECDTWTGQSDGFVIDIELQTMGVDPTRRHQTLATTPSGKTRTVNGVRDTLTGHSDFLLPLPRGGLPIRPGFRWTDTATTRSQGVGGEHLYEMIRTFTVGRALDTLGRHVTEVLGAGMVHYRDGWWGDRSAGTFTWLDVTGPTEEVYYLDVAAGQQVGRRWRMDLVGIGGVPSFPTDTLTAGLRSEEHDEPIAPERFQLLSRPRPPGDTSYTVDQKSQGLLFTHTVARSMASVVSSMARADGMLGTAESVSGTGAPVSYAAVWTSTQEPDVTLAVAVGADSVRVSGTRKVAYPVPPAPWGIADYAMTEHLVPVWLAMPIQQEATTLRVYRPFPDKWEDYQTLIRRVDDALLVIMRPLAKDPKDGSQVVSLYLITPDGDLLYGENSDPRGAVRVPRPGTSRRTKLERLLTRLRQ